VLGKLFLVQWRLMARARFCPATAKTPFAARNGEIRLKNLVGHLQW
jgi:hypothetical protein